MLVKEVRKINDRKRKVLFEDGFSFVLYSAEIHRFQIRSGEDVPEEVIRQICEILDLDYEEVIENATVDPEPATQAAMRVLNQVVTDE